MPVHDNPEYQGGVNWDTYLPGQLIAIQPGVSWPFEYCGELIDDEATPFNMYGPRDYVRRFQVVVNKDVRMSSAEVCLCPGIPRPFSVYMAYRPVFTDNSIFVDNANNVALQDTNAYAVKITAKRDRANDENEHRSYVVTVSYSTDMPEGGPPTFPTMGLAFQPFGIQNQPWLFPPKLEWDSQEFTTAPLRDLDGRPYVNSAGTPFLPSFTQQDAYHVLTVTRNETSLDWDNNREFYKFKVSEDVVKGYPPGYVLCMPGRAQEMYLGEIQYWRVSYRLLCKTRKQLTDGTFTPGWQPKILDAGLYQKGPDITPIAGGLGVLSSYNVPIMLYGQQVTQPQLLDGHGVRQVARFEAGVGIPADLVGQQIPVFLDFREFASVPLLPLLRGK